MIKAAVLVKPKKLIIQEFPEIEKFNGIICKISLSGICGTDFHIYNGNLKVPYPIILGHENVGIVEKNNTNMRDSDGNFLGIGQRVIFGADIPCGKCWYCKHLEYPRGKQLCDRCITYGMSISTDNAFPLSGGWSEKIFLRQGSYILSAPDYLSDEEIVLVDSIASTWNIDRILNLPYVKPTENAVILGAGTIGILSAIRCKIRGIKNIIIIDKHKYRINFIRKFIKDVIPMRYIKNEKEKINKIIELTNDRGADIVIDATGKPSALNEAIHFCRKGGTISEIGAFADLGFVSIKPVELVHKDLFIISQYGYPPEEYKISLEILKNYHQEYHFEKLVTHTIKLENLPKLFNKRFVKEKKYIKIVVKP
ncbi:MAG: alcohol dehydrogenase catalytic domain-containing protein [Candidatus Omnitrophica bacterium]|nr:alcohol dehydrogenase catalytic domain-containing protein [Candidatus Omnitrophota bacterium]